MPARTVDLHRLARQDFRKVANWYARRSASAARDFVAAMRQAVVDIGTAAESYPIELHNVRWLLLRQFPYLVRFQIVNDYTCKIVAISHKGRRPGHWLGRLRRP